MVMTDNLAFFGNLGATLQVLRLLKDVSQAELARRAGIRPNQISRYETGQVFPQLGQLAKILDALEIDLFGLAFAMQYLRWTEEVLEHIKASTNSTKSSQATFVLLNDVYQRQQEALRELHRAVRAVTAQAEEGGTRRTCREVLCCVR